MRIVAFVRCCHSKIVTLIPVNCLYALNKILHVMNKMQILTEGKSKLPLIFIWGDIKVMGILAEQGTLHRMRLRAHGHAVAYGR